MPAHMLLSESSGRSGFPGRAFVVSLLLHGLIVLPLWTGWGVFAPTAPAARLPSPDQPPPGGESYQFIELPPAPAAPPAQPTQLLAEADRRAMQPEAAERPPGAAFQAGRSPLPSAVARSGERGGASARSEAEEDAAAGRRQDLAFRPPVPRAPGGLLAPRDSLTTDRRLAIPRTGIGRRSDDPRGRGATGMLPEPTVDQRLTRAEIGSAFSLNTTAWDYAPYLTRLKARIEQQIFPPPAFYYGTAAWATRVRFRIAPDGRLTALTMLDHRGVENLQHVAVEAIRGAADYEPLPPGFPEPWLEIVGSFYFNVTPSAGR